MRYDSLDHLVTSNTAVILDSSAMSHLNSPDSNPLHNKSDKGIKIQNKSITKLIELSEEVDNIYITLGVCEELIPQSLIRCLEVTTQHIGSIIGKDAKHQQARTRKKRRNYIRIKRKREEIMEFLESRGRVLDFSDKEEYEKIDINCRKIKEYCNLSDVDWDFLISGILLSRQKSPVCLVSNDFGILEAYKLCLECGLFQERDLTFYFRTSFQSYDKAILSKELKKALSNHPK